MELQEKLPRNSSKNFQGIAEGIADKLHEELLAKLREVHLRNSWMNNRSTPAKIVEEKPARFFEKLLEKFLMEFLKYYPSNFLRNSEELFEYFLKKKLLKEPSVKFPSYSLKNFH